VEIASRKGTLFLVIILLLCILFALGYWRWTGQLPRFLLELLIDRIRVPPGFTIQLYATHVPNARSMVLGSREPGKVHALVDRDHGNKANEVIIVARGLNMPNGVAFRNGALYVAEVNRVLQYDDIEAGWPIPLVVVNAALPSDLRHGWKFIGFGPDGWLYVPVGAPCNVCERADDRYATIMRMHADGSGLEVFARGIRNTVGFDWDPQTRALWHRQRSRSVG